MNKILVGASDQSKALVVFSGGQDSTTCLVWAIKNYGADKVTAVTFKYGQKHIQEIKQAELIASKLGVKFELIDAEWLGQMSASALTRSDINVPKANDWKGDYPPTFVPGRNHIFLSLAAIYAFHNGINDIITGVCETDFSGYPDCRHDFILSLNTTLNKAFGTYLVDGRHMSIVTPLMRLDKAETWKLADDLGYLDFIKEHTLTCYNGIVGDGCGECDSCKLRKNGYDEYIKTKR